MQNLVNLFSHLIEYPMLLIYYIQNIFKRPAIDRSLGHKMITQFWVKDEAQDCEYLNFNQGREFKQNIWIQIQWLLKATRLIFSGLSIYHLVSDFMKLD